jgi:hypothetical protein
MLKVNRMGAKSEEMKETKTIRLSLFMLKDGQGWLNMDNLG